MHSWHGTLVTIIANFTKLLALFFAVAFLPFFSISLSSLYVIPEKPFWELISFFFKGEEGKHDNKTCTVAMEHL